MQNTIKDYVQLVTLKELAEVMDIPHWRLARWRRQGLIPSVKMGRTNYFNADSVRRTLQRREKLGSQHFGDTGYAKN